MNPVCTKKPSSGTCARKRNLKKDFDWCRAPSLTVSTSENRIELDELGRGSKYAVSMSASYGMSTRLGSVVIAVAAVFVQVPDTSHDESMSNRAPLP